MTPLRRPISIVQLIDRHPEPEYAQFCEFNLPADAKRAHSGVGNRGRSAFSSFFTGRSRVFPWIVLGVVGVGFAAFWMSVLMEVSK